MTTASEHSLILPATADLVWGTVSFVIVALAIFKFAWPTFMRLLDERTQKIDEGLNQAERAREEAARERAADPPRGADGKEVIGDLPVPAVRLRRASPPDPPPRDHQDPERDSHHGHHRRRP